MTTVQDGLRFLTQYLQNERQASWPEVVVDHPMREARLLLAHAMLLPADRLSLLAYDQLDESTLETALIYASRRRMGEPASHIVGSRAFYGRDFFVDKRVLDPRPETETLIAAALAAPFSQVLDLGTGSGAIIVTLMCERPDSVGVAMDLSEDALAVAEQNATTHGVVDRIGFDVSDWFQAVGGQFDLIVSNPPYIAADEMGALQPEVRLYEPRIALTDGADGLTAYRRITAGAPDHLTPGGRLIVEIGPTQAAAVAQMMTDAGLSDVSVTQDLDGRDRVVTAHKA
ncbi:peptide chain release factor N(5)-glutamine methyltransferase [Yoonia sp. BS5-3]|uniref:Release factor glutamine methyltransferase n=1 Tax=Yoonia phaeophyticola TaxID=3137369 RepID=A0ABZ2V6L9_9RHOB